MRIGAIQRNGISCILVALSTVVALVGAARAGSLRVIAKYGDPAPGSEGNFRTFGQLDGSDPAISGRNIAFGAVIDGGAGIYACIDGELRVIADTDTKIPGSQQRFGFPGISGSSPSISGENVAFGGRCPTDCLWAYINGSLVRIAGPSTPMPGTDGTFGGFHFIDGASPSISGENIAFTASSAETETNGIYAYINGELRVIADNHTRVPGATSARTFMNFGQLSGTSPSISGENVAFIGVWFAGAGVYAYIDGELRVIAATGTPAPRGGTFGTNFGQVEGARPSISGENVSFVVSAIYAYINGKLRVIADSDTPAPGSTGTFGALPVSPSISGENVGFGAGADGLGLAIFAYLDGTMRLIADKNTLVPGRDNTFSLFFLLDQSDFTGEGVRPAISGNNVVFTAAPNGVYAFFPPTRGDFDDDFCIDLKDVAAFQRCVTASNSDPDFLAACLAVFDFNDNNGIDLTDFAAFHSTLTGPQR